MLDLDVIEEEIQPSKAFQIYAGQLYDPQNNYREQINIQWQKQYKSEINNILQIKKQLPLNNNKIKNNNNN